MIHTGRSPTMRHFSVTHRVALDRLFDRINLDPKIQIRYQESQKDTEATRDHYLHISPTTSHEMEAVCSMVKKIYGRQPGDPMEDFNVNFDIWRMFMNTTLRAAVHLGKDYDMNLSLWLENNGTAFQRNRKVDQWSDRNHWHKPDQFADLRWVSTSLLHSRAYQYSTARVSVFSDAVLCFWKKGDNPV